MPNRNVYCFNGNLSNWIVHFAMARRALVTGATGFIGSAVVRLLIDEGWHVRTIARAGGDRRNISDLPVTVIEGDLKDSTVQERALENIDDLFHVAADYRLWVPEPSEMYATNVDATVELLQAAVAAGVERCVFTSSVATLGILENGQPADESTPSGIDHMIGHYKRSKFLAEEAVKKLADQDGVPVVIVNPAAPIGPRDRKPTPTGRIVLQAGQGKVPAFVDTGLNVVHVDDVARGHLLAWQHGRIGERYILGSENLRLQEILNSISELCGKPPPRFELPVAAIMPVAHVADWFARTFGLSEPFVTVDGVKLAQKKMFFCSDKAIDELGYTPRPAIEAMADAVGWYRENGYL